MLDDTSVNNESPESVIETPAAAEQITTPEPAPAVADDLPRPPSGRRSKTRPAGPPKVSEPTPAAAAVDPAHEDEQIKVALKKAAPHKAAAKKAATKKAAIDKTTGSERPPRTRRATKPVAEAVAPEVVEEADDHPQGEIPDLTPIEPAAGHRSQTRRRSSSRRPVQALDESLAGSADEIEAALAAAENAAAGRRRAKAAEGEVDKEQMLASLAAAIAGRPAAEAETALAEAEVAAEAALIAAVTHELSADDQSEHADIKSAEADESSDDSEAATDEAEASDEEQGESSGSSQRRRRRRGGRRRRRSSSGAGDESDEHAEDDAETEAAAVESDHQSGDKADEDKSGEQEESGESAGSSTRRRRRRRRRGDDSSEDSDVVVRVREPKHASSDEVSGIEGSTRLEAKKQRRREGRAAGRHRAPILTEAEFLARRESVERVMMVRQRDDYTQLAVLEDNVLVEHYVDRSTSTSLIGNIYLGRVQNVLPSMEAVFIDIGRGRNAVLYAGEVDWDAFDVSSDRRKVEQVFKSGQPVLVQVSKDPVGAKGARLTGHVSLPGRYLVYSPGGHLSGISRKLPDSERHRLKKILDSVVSEESSVIVRTAAEGASEEELTADVDRLKAQWETIQKKAKQNTAPHQLYAEPDLTLRIIRDTFTEDFKHLFVAGNGGDDDVYEPVKDYLERVAPHLAQRLVKWDAAQGDPFAKFRIDEQISKALERKVFLPSGGSLVIDRTEAMTVIDVNTGKFTGTGGNLEETVTRNNLEAAEEIVRQLRLRDLGGIIVVDFIDMVLPSNRELLLRRLVECLGRDRTRHQVSEVTSLGLVQMTRKRIGTGLAEAFTEVCEQCGGRGYVRHDEPVDSQVPADGGERHSGKASSNNSSRSNNNRRSTNKAKPKPEEAPVPPKAKQVQPSEESKQAAARLAAAASRHHVEQPAAGAEPAADDASGFATDGAGPQNVELPAEPRQGELLPGDKPAGELEAGSSQASEQQDADLVQTV